MNAGIKAFQAYKETATSTAIMDATPHQLTGLLFKAALDKLAIAEGAISRGDVSARCDAISRATNIVIELKTTLNLENGGVVASELDRLYEFSISELLDANSQKSIEKIKETIAITGLKEEAKKRLIEELSKIYKLSSIYNWEVIDNTETNFLISYIFINWITFTDLNSTIKYFKKI